MGKRAILPEGYNPVGETLRRAITPAIMPEPEGREVTEKVVEIVRRDESKATAVAEPVIAVPEKEPIPEIANGREDKLMSVHVRCTASERNKWHDISREVTKENNTFSHIMRACLLLMENSYDELKKLSPDLQRLKRPALQDALGVAMYEKRISQYLYDAIRAAGRPKG